MSYYVNPHDFQCPWYPYAQMFGAPNIKWCEQTICSWISEPMNTWSNLSYLIAAIYLFYRVSKNKSTENFWFAPAMLLMGAFSFVYHLSNIYLTQVLDFLGMFLFTFWPLTLNLKRLEIIDRTHYLKVMAILTVSFLVFVQLMYVFHYKYQFLIVLIALAIFATEFLCFKRQEIQINYTNFKVAVVFLILAQTASLLDVTRTVCFTDSSLPQGHAIWHVLSCISLVFVYHHYEQIKSTQIKQEV